VSEDWNPTDKELRWLFDRGHLRIEPRGLTEEEIRAMDATSVSAAVEESEDRPADHPE
jgi:hypothetical protein